MRGVSDDTDGDVLCAAALLQMADKASETARERGFLLNSIFFSELLKPFKV
jgi:hypothetical protein